MAIERLRLRRLDPGQLTGSIRFRLTAWYVLILAVVLLVFGGIVYSVVAQSVSAQMYSTLRDDTVRLAAIYNPLSSATTFPTPGVSKIEYQLKPSDIAVMLDGQGSVMQVVGDATKANVEQIIGSSNDAWARSKVNISQINAKLQIMQKALMAGGKDPTAELANRAVLATSLAGIEGAYFDIKPQGNSNGNGGLDREYLFYSIRMPVSVGEIGTFILGRATEEGSGQLRLLLTALLIATPATLLLAALGGYWLATRAMRPVRHITRAAQGISEEDLHHRLNLSGRDELAELAATFDSMLDRLEGAFNRQRQFTADASHELRTPLTIVGLAANTAQSPASLKERDRALEVIQAEAEYMGHLVDELLFMARADARQLELRQERIDLSDLALEVVERLSTVARHKGVELSTGDLPEVDVVGDRHYISRALTNLVENAIKYTAACDDGHARQVRVESGQSAAPEGAVGWVRVADNGPGIAPEHLPYLFDRFYRADGARTNGRQEAPGGTGLGLSVAQWVAQAHGGELTVQTAPGRGSVFEVRLPLAASSTPAVQDTLPEAGAPTVALQAAR